MMISHRQVSRAAQAFLGEIAERERAKSGGVPGRLKDGVVISDQARDLRKWTERVAALPDGATNARLEALARDVATGAYRPSGLDIADQILARSLVDRLAGERSSQ